MAVMLNLCVACPTHVETFAEKGKIVCVHDSQVSVGIHITPQPLGPRVCPGVKTSLTSTSGQQKNTHRPFYTHDQTECFENILLIHYAFRECHILLGTEVKCYLSYKSNHLNVF